MAAETLKDYLLGFGFDIDEGSVSKADAVISQFDGLVKGLGKILENAAVAVQNLVTEFRGVPTEIDQTAGALDGAADAAQALSGSEAQAAQAADGLADANTNAAAATDNLRDKTEQAAKSSDKAKDALKKADKAAKMEGAKKGSENVSKLDEKLKKGAASAKAFIAAAAAMLIGSSIGQFVSDVYKLGDALVDNSKKLKKTVEETRAYQTALSVMGKTADEIAQSKSLTKTFEDLQAIGAQIALPETAQGLKGISDLKDGLMQLKFVGSYAMQWLLYKIQTVAEGPLAQVRDMMYGIKDWIGGNIEKIATNIAHAFGNVLQLFTSLITAIGAVVGWINKLPPAIKIAGAAAAAVIALINSKFARITAIISIILLLIDDFVVYMQGGESLFGGFWGKCIEWAEKAKPYVEAFINDFAAGIDRIWEAFKWFIDLIGGDAVVAIGLVSVALWALSANPVILIIAAIIGLIAGLGKLMNNWDLVQEKANEVWSAIVEWVTGACETIKGVWQNVDDWFSEKFQAAKEGIVNAWNTVAEFFSGVWDGIKAAFASVGEWFSGIFQSAKEGIVNAWNTVTEFFTGIRDGITNTFASIKEWFTGVFTSARDGVTGAWESVTGFFSGIWNAISENPTLSGIANVVSAPFKLAWTYIETVWNVVVAFFSGIWGLITGDATLADVLTSISQPFIDGWAKVKEIFAGVGEFFSGIWTSIKNVFAPVGEFFSGVATSMWTGITNITEDVGGWFTTNIWTPIKNTFNDALSFFTGIAGNVLSGITSGFDSIGTWFTDNVWTPIKNVFSLDGIVSFFKGVATNIWDGLTNGLSEKVGSVTETVKGFFSNIWDGVLSFFGIASPSKLAQTAGENVMEGFGNGTEGKESSITEKVKGVFSRIWDGVKSVWDGVTGWLGKLFGWGDEDESAKNEAQTEVSSAAGEVASAVTDSFSDIETAISEPIVNGTTTASEAFTTLQTLIETVMTAIQTAISNAVTNSNTSLDDSVASLEGVETQADTTASGVSTSFTTIVSEAKKLATGVINAIKNMPTVVQTTFTSLANSMITTFTNAATNVQSQVAKINSSLASIPRTISVTVSAKKAFSFGGVVDRETDAKIGEDGREYVIPITKPGRAISLLRSAAAELGMNVQTTRQAAAALGGRGDANVTPVYAAGNTNNNTITNTTQVSAPATINVYGNNAHSIADNVSRNQERMVLRNIKTALA